MYCSNDEVTFFFFNDTATTEIYTLSLHDALPISARRSAGTKPRRRRSSRFSPRCTSTTYAAATACRSNRTRRQRSEEHTSELQSRQYLVCRLLLENNIYPLTPSLISFTPPTSVDI